jgi:hypothetical protein
MNDPSTIPRPEPDSESLLSHELPIPPTAPPDHGVRREEPEVGVAQIQSCGKTMPTAINTFLSHPITILLLGTALSGILIPSITSNCTDHKLLQEAKLAQAKAILAQNTLVDKQLNTIQTTFECFVKDAQTGSRDYGDAQRELLKDINEQYKHFDEHAWWWYGDLLMQAKLLRLPEGTIKQIKALAEQYGTNLIQSTRAIDPEWNRLRGPEYKGPDHQEVVEATTVRL